MILTLKISPSPSTHGTNINVLVTKRQLWCSCSIGQAQGRAEMEEKSYMSSTFPCIGDI